MNPVNITKSPPPPPASNLLAKRKRGRPRKDEASTQQQNTNVIPKPDINLVGKAVTGVVESYFDAGYLLKVKVKDSDTVLRGLVFIPGKVHPITPENDLAPNVKMYPREVIRNSQSDDQLMLKDAVTTSGLEISDSTRALSLVPQASNGQKEPVKEKEGVIEEAETRLVELFPTPETMMTAQVPNPVVAEKETAQQIPPPPGFDLIVKKETEQWIPLSPGFELMARKVTEQRIPPPPGFEFMARKVTEQRIPPPPGFEFMAKKPVCPGEKVPEKLQLELGNKKILLSGENNNMATTTETDPKTSVSKSGFIANLFEGVEIKEEEASP